MQNYLTIRAGVKAIQRIRSEGLNPETIRVMAGAAGGPKWLVLTGLDHVICSSIIPKHPGPLFLIGSSIGAWRFAAYAHSDPVDAIKRLESVYIGQQYSEKPTVDEISAETLRVMNAFLSDDGVKEIIANPSVRLNMLSSRCRWPVAMEQRFLLLMGLASAALCNLISRELLRFFFKRALFFNPAEKPPFYSMPGFPLEQIPLHENNLKQALMASAAIPLVMHGVKNISGTTGSVYRDGGMIDYHLDIPFVDDNDIVLYPHYLDRIIPGWFDKKLGWRKPRKGHIDNVLLLAPSGNFVEKLPYGKIPDRTDFLTFAGHDDSRLSYWNTVISESERLGNEFFEAIETGEIAGLVEPL